MKRDGGAIFYRLSDTILVKISVRRIVLTEGNKGALAVGSPVNGGAGKPDICCIGQRSHQVIAQLTASCPVGFVYQYEEVLSGVDFLGYLIELVYHGDDKPSGITG
ncbi:MAG: hypothetical protein DDT33_01127 [Firmicutes bacterium]|nr:hypothetical protein [Bacillota bacterium]